MSDRWLWSQRWVCSMDLMSGRDVSAEIIQFLTDHGLLPKPKTVFGVRLALEEALINNLKDRQHGEAASELEIVCRVSMPELQMLIDGDVVYSESL